MRLALPCLALRRDSPGKFGKPLREKHGGRVLAPTPSLLEKCADLKSIQDPHEDRSALCSTFDTFYDARSSPTMLQTGTPPGNDDVRPMAIQQRSDPPARRSIRAVTRHTPIQQRGAFENREPGLLRTDLECQEAYFVSFFVRC